MNKIKKPSQSETIFVKSLNANDRFVVPGIDTIYVCESRRTMDNRTSVTYRVEGSDIRSEFSKVNLSTIYLLTD